MELYTSSSIFQALLVQSVDAQWWLTGFEKVQVHLARALEMQTGCQTDLTAMSDVVIGKEQWVCAVAVFSFTMLVY